MSAFHTGHNARVSLHAGMCRQASAVGPVGLAKAAQALLAVVGLDPRLDGRTFLAYYLARDFVYLSCKLLHILLTLLRHHLQSSTVVAA